MTSASAGSAFAMASRIALAFQTNMPEFQYQPPSFRNAVAVAASGFSLKRSTFGSSSPRRPRLDVAEPRFRPRGRDAEGDELALLRRRDGLAQAVVEGGHVADHVVGRQDHHDRILAVHEEVRRGQRDGGGGIARRRLEELLEGREGMEGLSLGALLARDDEHVVARDDGGRGGRRWLPGGSARRRGRGTAWASAGATSATGGCRSRRRG